MKTFSRKQVRTYTNEQIENFVDKHGGEIITMNAGTLGLGNCILWFGKNKKVGITKEIYLNEWSSGQSLRLYNKIPAKYKKFIN